MLVAAAGFEQIEAFAKIFQFANEALAVVVAVALDGIEPLPGWQRRLARKFFG